jgi:serralysin
MALNVVNGAPGQIIQNAGSWYAYNTNSVFLPKAGGTFAVTLGTTQDDVTHIDALPMRADLLTLTGNGSNLAFSMTGDGVVDIHVKTPGTNIVSVQGAPAATLVGDDLSLTFNDGALAISATSPQGVPIQHNVAISEGAAVLTTGTNILFGGSGASNLVLTGMYENYTITTNGTAGETFVDTRAGTPDGTDIVSNVQSFTFSDGLKLSQAQLADAIAGTGRLVTLDNGSGTLTSANPGQVILGLGGNDITAGAANQTLDSGSGTYTLDDRGYAGVTLIGSGNETYIVSNASTKVIEMIKPGNDVVQTSVANYTLPANVNNLIFTAAGPQTGTGNGSNDTFTASDNHQDTFVFKAGFGTDIITNFAASDVNHDILQLSRSMFPAGTTADSLLNAPPTAPAHAQQVGANVVITADAHDQITLNNVLLTTLKANAAADIHFV